MNGAMNMIRRIFAGLFMALVFSGAAHAAPPVQVWVGQSQSVPTNKSTLPSEPLGAIEASWATQHTEARRGPCRVNSISGATAYGECLYIPASGSSWYMVQNATKRWYCAADPTKFVTEATVCADTCVAGQSTTFTWFKEWAYDSAGSSTVPGTEVEHPDPYCDGSCQWEQDLDRIDDITCQGPDEPSDNGYFATTCTYPYKSTGVSCTVKDPDPEAPEPSDPNPGTGDGGGDGDGDGGGDPGDGDGDGDGDGSGDGDGDGSGDGDGDGSGTGGGQCPVGQTSDGNGGCVSTGGSGPGEGEDEGGGECGIPGKPPCAVKVDETGVPDGNSIFNGVNTQVENLPNHASFKDAIDGIKNNSDLTPSWTWTFQLPTGCTPFQLAGFNFSIDVCQWQGMIHDIMSMIWAAATVWFLIALFMRAGD